MYAGEIAHYSNCLMSGFQMDWNDFSLEEQILINYTVSKLKIERDNLREKNFYKFFKKGFDVVTKAISKRRL